MTISLSTVITFTIGAALGSLVTRFLQGGNMDKFIDGLLQMAEVAVKAAEQKAKNESGKHKKRIAVSTLVDEMADKGFPVPPELADTAIEASVYDMNNGIDQTN